MTLNVDEKSLLAFDRSARIFDTDGRMHVAESNLTKACVNPYYGREILNYVALGLEENKVYFLLRDPEELKKAVDTFNNIPVLSVHAKVDAIDPKKELVVGTTGSDAKYAAPYITASLAVWDAKAIAGIETKQQTELSASYYYTADMTAGTYEGQPYDGVMRDIKANHIALVVRGRAGRDVVVSDHNPFTEKEVVAMNRTERLNAAQAKARQALTPVLASDADPEVVTAILQTLAEDSAVEDVKPNEPPPKKEGDEEDEEGKKKKPEKVAMDADAINAAIATARAEAATDAVTKVTALYAAREKVKPLVGVVAMDSAEDTYAFALKQSGVNTDGVHPTAYASMVDMALQLKSMPVVAHDADLIQKTHEALPALGRFKQA